MLGLERRPGLRRLTTSHAIKILELLLVGIRVETWLMRCVNEWNEMELNKTPPGLAPFVVGSRHGVFSRWGVSIAPRVRGWD